MKHTAPATSTSDQIYMQRCLQLAALAQGRTSPNPMVGSVIVYKDKIIGEGYHHYAGAPHAEVMAWRSVPEELRSVVGEATWYVSLEPCAHYGKTPPCAELIAGLRPARVVIAMLDPFAKVDGRGVARLREAGIEVSIGCLEQEAIALNRHFLVAQTLGRPYVTLKWAESADHYIDRLRHDASKPPYVFSSPLRQRSVHRLRALHDAILVGHHTAELDDPLLTNRSGSGGQPIRLLWCHSRLPRPDLRMLQDATAPTILLLPPALLEQVTDGQYPPHVSCLATTGEVRDLLTLLRSQGIESLLVEGGAQVLQRFLDADLYDELNVEHAPVQLHEGVSAPHLEQV